MDEALARKRNGYRHAIRGATEAYKRLVAFKRHPVPDLISDRNGARVLREDLSEILDEHGPEPVIRELLDAIDYLMKSVEHDRDTLEMMVAALRQDVISQELLRRVGWCRRCRSHQ